jgi:hypothetical protein
MAKAKSHPTTIPAAARALALGIGVAASAR